MQIKEIVILLITSIGLTSYADMGNKIEQINKAVKSVGNQPEECSTCNVVSAGISNDLGSLMKSCVETICSSKTNSIVDILNEIYQKAATPNSTYDNEIQPLIIALANENAKDKIAQSNIYSKWLQDPPDLKTPGAIRIFNMLITLKTFSMLEITEENGKPIIDVAKSRSAFPEISDEEFNKKIQISGKILDAFLDRAISDTDPSRIQLIYGNGFKARVNEVLNSFAEKKRQIENDPELNFLTKLQAFKEMASGEKLKQQFADIEEINPDTIVNLNRTNSVLNLFLAISKDSEFKKILNSPPINMKKANISLGTEKILRDREAQQQAVLSGKTPIFSGKCRLAFEMAQHILPTERDLELFKSKMEEMKNNFLNKTKSLSCDEQLKNYKSQVSSWSANSPLTKEQHLNNMKASLNRALRETKKWKQQNEEVNRSSDRDTILSISLATLTQDYNSATSFSDDLCDNLMPNILPDAANLLTNGFVTGPIPIKYDETKGLAYHELGHKLFQFLKYQNTCMDRSRLVNAQACLLSIHTELSPEELLIETNKKIFGGNYKYESEDWADLISAHVEDQASNFACLFAKRSTNEEYKNFSLRNSKESDPHSSDLFRLLHTNFIKNGKIPDICQQALTARGEKANFKDCLQTK